MQTDIIGQGKYTRVILISGHAQNGKDTTALMMKEAISSTGDKAIITHYADLLKYICKEYFDWDGKKDDYGRNLLQYVGTDVIRKKNPTFWVDFISDILSCFNGYWDYVIIPDARFPDEITTLKENGFEVTHIRVVRNGFESPLTQEQQSHSSETALNGVLPDFYIYNDGNLGELNHKVHEWVMKNLYKWRDVSECN